MIEIDKALGYLNNCRELTISERDKISKLANSAMIQFFENFGDSYSNITISDKNGIIICDYDMYNDSNLMELNIFEIN